MPSSTVILVIWFSCNILLVLKISNTYSCVILKQSPLWPKTSLSCFVSCSQANNFFFFHSSNITIFLIVYVDDILVIRNDPSQVLAFPQYLHITFALHDLGCINYFLGIEVSYVNGAVHLNQQKYIQDVLTRSTMQDLKSISTHGTAGTNLSQFASDTFSKTSLCRSIVGPLQYVTIIKQNISYAVNKACLYMAHPIIVHWMDLKWILRYLKGTPSLGLIFQPSTSLDIQVYTDVDWASCPDDRCSTIGYYIFLGSNLVSWSSTKQRTISRRSSESEYCALVATVAEITCIQFVFQELCISILSPLDYLQI